MPPDHRRAPTQPNVGEDLPIAYDVFIMSQKPQRRSIRIPHYDYGQPGAYFITLVTHRRGCILSQIENGQIVLSSIGQFVEREWMRLPVRFPHIHLDVYTVMPNHLHGIIVIDTEITGGDFLHNEPAENFSKPVAGSIPTIIRSYKSSTTLKFRNYSRDQRDLWQRNYFERIIRNDNEWQRIRDYILANPLNWENDQENPE